MNTLQGFLDGINTSLKYLEKNETDDFDRIASVMSILYASINILMKLYDNSKLTFLREEDETSFYRFISKLKNSLELKRDYLNSIQDALKIDNDQVTNKLNSYKNEIESTLDSKENILIHIKPLLTEENKLRKEINELNRLIKKKEELENISTLLQSTSKDDLILNIEKLQKEKEKFERDIKPLINEKCEIEKQLKSLKTRKSELNNNIDRLKGATTDESNKLTEEILNWIKKLKDNRGLKEKKNVKYLNEVEKETNELKKIEGSVKENIKKINEITSSVMTKQEILRIHFTANKDIKSKFLNSLPNQVEDLELISKEIEDKMEQFDKNLHIMQKKIEEIVSQIEPISFSG